VTAVGAVLLSPFAAAGALPADDPTLSIAPAPGGTTLTGGVGAPLVEAAPYLVSGGSGQVTWSYSGLPAGIAAKPSSGVLGGTPTLDGTYDVTVTVTDQDGQSQSGPATFYIDPIGLSTRSGPLFAYVVAVVHDGVSTQPVIETGDTFGSTWSANGLPPGLQLDSQTGLISGSPTTVGGYTTRFKVINAAGDTAYLPVLFEVVTAYTCNYQQSGRVGSSLTINCGVFWSANPNHGGRWLALPGHLGYSASGLPGGLRIDSGTGLITGTPQRPGTSAVTVTVSAKPDGILVTKSTKWASKIRCAISG
jgi:hypothetical protein